MIKLTKGTKPNVLEVKRGQWDKIISDELSKGNPLSKISLKYNHPEIKEGLREETYGKCAYCESKIEHISYAHIEHILPKTIFPELTYEWNNLTFCCERCNKLKGDYYNNDMKLVNPYEDDLDSIFLFLGPTIVYKDIQGQFTIDKLQLNRMQLVEKRMYVVEEIAQLISNYNTATIEPIKEMYYKQILEMVNPQTEYSAVASSVLNQVLQIS
ncbi:TIGR02646 family protein [Terribacillus saccharophilus]|uniref:TIGR02646 family protein n=1 Tax=Terribacillus saccharophilus TaxID=361277 RepID=A0A268HEI1_9BACI|nr:retron system putative HNH endonuclease [Terribacillus saccharophilus]PAE08250.1 TIGR02646 family protein [Terribacillus saccharophilus]